jgi:hypothetical protein
MLGVAVMFLSLATSATAQPPQKVRLASDADTKVTLFAVNKYHGEYSGCLKLSAVPDCQLRYGALYAGDDWDWFESSVGRGDRTAIRDLGLLSWTDAFKVPVVEPFPKLKPGEQRHVTVDTSGADGADGADADGVVRPRQTPGVDAGVNAPAAPKHDGKPKIDPIFAKVIAGHMYVIHVVTEASDFYALIHVEMVERGDNCTVSWRTIPTPELGDQSAAK